MERREEDSLYRQRDERDWTGLEKGRWMGEFVGEEGGRVVIFIIITYLLPSKTSNAAQSHMTNHHIFLIFGLLPDQFSV
jgi:hypothetical protein